MIFGLATTGRSVARWWRQHGVAFHAVDTRAALAAESTTWPEMANVPMAFGEPLRQYMHWYHSADLDLLGVTGA